MNNVLTIRARATFWTLTTLLWLLISFPSANADSGGVIEDALERDNQSHPNDLAKIDLKPFPSIHNSQEPVIPLITDPLSPERAAEILSKLALEKAKPPAGVSPMLSRIDNVPVPSKAESRFNISLTSQSNALSGKSFRILDYAPEGEVRVASTVTISFSEPMVPLTDVQNQNSHTLPISIEPKVAGKWRWLDNRTICFQSTEKMLPMATEYRVTVSGVTCALSGKQLEKTSTWTFSTPPIETAMPRSWPLEKPGVDDPIAVNFDQRIKPASILPYVQLTEGANKIAVRLANNDEIEKSLDANFDAANFIGHGHSLGARGPRDDECTLWLKPLQALKAGTNYGLDFPAGLPSAEGPLRSKKTIESGFTVEDRQFYLLESQFRKSYPSGEPWFIVFSHEPDGSRVKKTMIKVTPPLPKMNIEYYYESLMITGEQEPGKTYTVELDHSLPGRYGNTLGKDQKIEITTTAATPNLIPSGENPIIATGKRGSTFHIYSINHKQLQLKIWKVTSQDWNSEFGVMKPPKRSPDYVEVIDTKFAPNVINDTPFNLSPYLQGGKGHVALQVSAIDKSQPRYKNSGFLNDYFAWIECTDLGLRAESLEGEVICRTTNLQNGEVLKGVSVSVSPEGKTALSDASGLAVIDCTVEATENSIIEARLGEDFALLPDFRFRQPNGAKAANLRVYGFADRDLYRPGEEIHMKGWIRLVDPNSRNGLALINSVNQISYRCLDSRDGEISKGSMKLSRSGGFDCSFKISEACSLGTAKIEIQCASVSKALLSFRIQEFRRPNYQLEVSTKRASELIAGDICEVTAVSKYFTGTPLSKAKLRWSVGAQSATYQPPGWNAFIFQDSTLWISSLNKITRRANQAYLDGETDGSGTTSAAIKVDEIQSHQPVRVSAQAEIIDDEPVKWTEYTEVLYHPAKIYVGLKYEAVSDPGKSEALASLIVTDIAGHPVPGKQVQISTKQIEGIFNKTSKTLSTLTVESGLSPVTFKFPKDEKCNAVSAEVKDSDGRLNRSSMILDDGYLPLKHERHLSLLLDRPDYLPGQTAQLTVLTPNEGRIGFLTLYANGIVNRRVVRFTTSYAQKTVSIPVLECYGKGCYATLTIYNNSDFTPVETGAVEIPISIEDRRLTAKVEPAKVMLEPGEKSTIAIHVADQAGRPVAGAEVAVAAVDQSVLVQTGFEAPDPMSSFYPQIGQSYFATEDVRQHFFLSQSKIEEAYKQILRTPSLQTRVDYCRGSNFSIAQRNQPRKSFTPLAVFAPSAVTNEDGNVVIQFQAPDTLTRYTISAVIGTADSHFGRAFSSFVVDRNPAIRVNAPRFLRQTDRFDLPISIGNNAKTSLQLDVAARSTDGIIKPTGVSVRIAAGARGLLSIPGQVQENRALSLQVATECDQALVDSIEIQMPIKPNRSTETTAVYGTLDNADEVISCPIQWPSASGRAETVLKINGSCSAGIDLDSALQSLKGYKFECTEQIASRLIALSAIFGENGQNPGNEEQNTQEIISKDIASIVSRQHPNGPIWLWPQYSDWDQSPFVTIHAIHALYRAKEAGFAIPEKTFVQAQTFFDQLYLDDIVRSRISRPPYPRHTRLFLAAYSAYVLDLLGKPNDKFIDQICNQELSTVPPIALAWVLPTLKKANSTYADKVAQAIANTVKETASTANFIDYSKDPLNLMCSSDIRQNAVILNLLVNNGADNPLIPKLVNSLLMSRGKDGWSNTNETAFCVLALKAYSKRYEKEEPSFDMGIWLGEDHLGQYHMSNRNQRQELVITDASIDSSKSDRTLTLQKKGRGRLYYRIGMSRTINSPQQPSKSQGFSVTRICQGVEDSNDVKVDEKGLVHIKQGALVKVTVKFVNPLKAFHLALVDEFPAALEPLNPSLRQGRTNSGMMRFALEHSWPIIWYDHSELHDDRAEAFTSSLEPGEYTYEYLARAYMKGSFNAPPARVEEMYAPETVGQSSSTKFVVE